MSLDCLPIAYLVKRRNYNQGKWGKNLNHNSMLHLNILHMVFGDLWCVHTTAAPSTGLLHTYVYAAWHHIATSLLSLSHLS